MTVAPPPASARPGPAEPHTVVTPEAVPLEFPHAHLGSRSLALGLDLLIMAVIGFALFFGLTSLLDAADASLGLGVAAFLVLVFLLIWGYPVIQETLWRGRTVGKVALGLRVVTTEGAPVRFRHAAIRASLGLVDFWVTWGAAAVLSVLLTRDNQRLGDLAAGTYVLRERSALRPVTPVTFVVPPGLEGYASALDVAGVDDEHYRAIRAFLLRAASLPLPVRADLALQLARPVASRVHPPPPPGLMPEAFLVCVAAVYQGRRRDVAHRVPPAADWSGTPPAAPPPYSAPPAPPSPPPPAPPAPPPPSPAPPPAPSAPPGPADGGFVPPA